MTGFRRLRFGLTTVLGLAQRGFFIPYRYAGDVPPAGARPAYDEIARITSLPIGTVKNRIFRAREILRVQLSDILKADVR